MAARNAAPRKNQTGMVFVLIVIVLIVLAGYGFYRYQTAPPAQAPVAALQPGVPAADIVSEDRIIFGGMPRARGPDTAFTTLKNIAYMVGYSERRKDPLWSAYRVIRMAHPFVLARPTGDFLTDDRTEARVAHHDYTGSGYDRGHMTPNAAIARCYGAEAQKETFLLSNICPQAPNLNREVWEKLEKMEIEYTQQLDEVWVMDGPIFADRNGGTTRTLRSGIAVPASFYKIVIEDEAGKIRLFCVIMPQGVKGTELPQQFLTSVREIEKQTGLEFLWKLDPHTRESLETPIAPLW
jgi:endonuclease G